MVLHKPCTTNSKQQKCNYFGSVIMLGLTKSRPHSPDCAVCGAVGAR